MLVPGQVLVSGVAKDGGSGRRGVAVGRPPPSAESRAVETRSVGLGQGWLRAPEVSKPADAVLNTAVWPRDAAPPSIPSFCAPRRPIEPGYSRCWLTRVHATLASTVAERAVRARGLDWDPTGNCEPAARASAGGWASVGSEGGRGLASPNVIHHSARAGYGDRIWSVARLRSPKHNRAAATASSPSCGSGTTAPNSASAACRQATQSVHRSIAPSPPGVRPQGPSRRLRGLLSRPVAPVPRLDARRWFVSPL